MALKKAAPKKAVKKAAPKKAAPKKAVTKAAAPKKVVAKGGPLKEKMTKSQIIAALAETAGLTKAQVSAVMDGFEDLIGRSLGKKALGEFTIPGLMKIFTKSKPATKAEMKMNPFSKQMEMRKAKPASIVVKVRPLKKMKEFAAN